MPACLPVDINHHQVCLEIAKKLEQPFDNRINKKAFRSNYALLFDLRKFGFERRVFWTTEGMKFPIDMIFIKDNKIITINYNLKPCKYKSDHTSVHTSVPKCQVFGGFPVDYVIKTSAGNTNKWEIFINQKFNVVFESSDLNSNKPKSVK